MKVTDGIERVQSVSELAMRVAMDPKLAASIAEKPAETLLRLAAPLESDVWIYRIVVGALGLAVVLAVLGGIVLASLGKGAPEILVAIGSAAVGALAGLLAPSPASRK